MLNVGGHILKEIIMDKKELIAIKDSIIDTRVNIKDLTSKKKKSTQSMKDIINARSAIILDAVDSKGKALYSNAQKRTAKLEEELKDDAIYLKLKDIVDDMEEELKELEIDLESFKYDFKIEDIISRGV